MSIGSPSYWAGLSFFVAIFDDTVFGGCEDEVTRLACCGDTFLLYYGVDQRPFIPGYSLWISLAITVDLSLIACTIAYMKSNKKLKLGTAMAVENGEDRTNVQAAAEATGPSKTSES